MPAPEAQRLRFGVRGVAFFDAAAFEGAARRRVAVDPEDADRPPAPDDRAGTAFAPAVLPDVRSGVFAPGVFAPAVLPAALAPEVLAGVFTPPVRVTAFFAAGAREAGALRALLRPLPSPPDASASGARTAGFAAAARGAAAAPPSFIRTGFSPHSSSRW
jgi:hypothetical protein